MEDSDKAFLLKMFEAASFLVDQKKLPVGDSEEQEELVERKLVQQVSNNENVERESINKNNEKKGSKEEGDRDIVPVVPVVDKGEDCVSEYFSEEDRTDDDHENDDLAEDSILVKLEQVFKVSNSEFILEV